MMVLYDLAFALSMVLYLPILVLRGKWHSGTLESLGFMSREVMETLAATRNIWIHAVSVGEVAAVEGIITGLRRDYPGHRIVLTVTTKTGHSFARQKYRDSALVLWSPLDLSIAAGKFVRAIRPVIYIVAETELWPSLFVHLSQDRVPIVIVNGRISDKAFPRYRLARNLLRNTLRRVKIFGMQSRLDAERIIEMKADANKVHVTGNLKFDSVPEGVAAAPSDYGLDGEHQVLLAASTHPGEEDILLDIFRSLKRTDPALRLVLVPRHPERAFSVAEAVRKTGFVPVLLSGNHAVIRQEEVLIVDSIGHLVALYSLARVAFVGKSLTVKGGHNIIEPAVFGKPIVIGPHMQNFNDITQAFLAGNGVIQVKDAAELKAAIEKLLDEPDMSRGLGDRARMIVHRHRGATARALDLIRGVMPQ
ncbi:MAG: 3-deoxy-D-manno-octulosonic acid transferase [Syntrophobacteraceae bacterium]